MQLMGNEQVRKESVLGESLSLSPAATTARSKCDLISVTSRHQITSPKQEQFEWKFRRKKKKKTSVIGTEMAQLVKSADN